MTYRLALPRLSLSCLLLSALACGLIVAPASAQALPKDAPPAYDKSDKGPPSHHDMIQGPHVEGHIAFLHAELGITPEQEPLWQPVADAMREDVRNMDDMETRVSQQDPDRENAIEYLQNRAAFAHLRADGEDRFLAAMQPLYNKLSSQQRQMADELLIQHRPEPQ